MEREKWKPSLPLDRTSPPWLGIRAGRTLSQSDLQLVALSFIAEAPRHGYAIIKLVKEKTADCYSPSSGTVYPTLMYLKKVGYVTAAAEGLKKSYAITSRGRDYLKANRDLVETMLDRLTALGKDASRRRRAARGKTINRSNLPPLIEAAFDYLRETASRRLEDDAEAEAQLVEIITRAEIELQRK